MLPGIHEFVAFLQREILRVFHCFDTRFVGLIRRSRHQAITTNLKGTEDGNSTY
ncbi:hypothetical protein A678_03993 [Salmonella enterica subsp. enterica serovar Enteritidis str. 2010K-0271]|uniref:Uncharacterized protein n=1 Tax=Salmonella enterica subsp. enterica serovar Dublin str. UC16 TaxID=1192688 RepID=M7RCL4_SALDU|nr:hypothetical protein A670_03777 [Salmonella enterica subsp. enterica serovar Dublin str. UC16]EPI77348.1 hypothetical protein A672_00483 [Salmonella enterica subsp. enterica serovar Enteritidis str. 08-1080]EPI94288.1 hypothetical protein A678_03993 [Salmonella enterica subsp. enterica serovar Enteritidis str. 2010K-0271]